MLAYYFYPSASNQDVKEYSKEDLMNPKKVEELFDYCQILEAYITKTGWQFLIEHYGYEKLFEIDKRSGWLSERTEDTLEEYIEWVKYEIEKSWNDGKGVLGIYIHNLKDQNQERSEKGDNPFEQFTCENGKKLSDYVKTYNPPYGTDSKANYNYIAENIENWIETAINDRK